MNEVDYLKSFSVKEIALKTHLDEARIKAIINKDYENLSSVNIAMNIKILEREYNIDFSEWLNEYNEYKNNHFKDKKNSLKVKPKVMGYNSDKESNSNLAYFIYLSLATIIVIAGVFYYFNYYDENSQEVVENTTTQEKPIEELQVNQQENSTQTKTQIEPIKEVKEEIKPATPLVEKKLEEVKEDKKPENLEESKINTKEETIQIPAQVELIPEIKPQEIKTQEVKVQEVKSNEIKEEKAEIIEPKVEIKKDNKLLLSPNSKVWVSVKNLKTKETKNYMIVKSASFTQDSLIFVGNNLFTLELDGSKIELPSTNDARYILFKDGKVTFLSQKEYTKLDKAK
ncbi:MULTISPECIES: hypothetical protein [unclassified Campylobacter]|uniref:hypothetical protein n=1 Tax=unclassified Campylobacter TaxID=2593542 RepID=UPI001BDA583C|nr:MULTISPECIES: hypothetical protein [unclassified Campylobacter]MBT0880579.1 hypothetical protein [Campylobacter sp. 2018MI27]MBT0884331.1 hypothetical protein [Campylobacter sp. 2018MI10]MBZ7981035.1 hypothetical protein [Campylobacter sp. RM12640]MBZ7988354.1 hypothetical protein [Campylobacter sp. RM12635]